MAAAAQFMKAGQTGSLMLQTIRNWLLCGFDSNNPDTDILSHVEIASMESGGKQQFSAMCQALHRLSDSEDGEDAVDIHANRQVFAKSMKDKLSDKLWTAMLGLQEEGVGDIEWKKRLSTWLSAYQFVLRHFPPSSRRGNGGMRRGARGSSAGGFCYRQQRSIRCRAASALWVSICGVGRILRIGSRKSRSGRR